MTDFTSARRTHAADFADRERREVVLMHEPFGLHWRQIIDDLRIIQRTERRH